MKTRKEILSEVTSVIVDRMTDKDDQNFTSKDLTLYSAGMWFIANKLRDILE